MIFYCQKPWIQTGIYLFLRKEFSKMFLQTNRRFVRRYAKAAGSASRSARQMRCQCGKKDLSLIIHGAFAVTAVRKCVRKELSKHKI
jgi:hypothetical protein